MDLQHLRLLGCIGSDAAALDMYDGEIERAANYLLDGGIQTDLPPTHTQTRMFVLNGLAVTLRDPSALTQHTSYRPRTTQHYSAGSVKSEMVPMSLLRCTYCATGLLDQDLSQQARCWSVDFVALPFR